MITGTYSPDIYTVSGGQTVYPITFDFISSDDIRVILRKDGVDTDLTSGVDFTVSESSVAISSELEDGDTIVVYQEIPQTQSTDYKNTGNYDLEVLEASLDKLTLITQGLQSDVDRSVKALIGESPEPYLEDCREAREGAEAAQRAAETAYSDTLTEKELVLEAGDTQTSRVISEGDTQASRITTLGDAYVDTVSTAASEAEASADRAEVAASLIASLHADFVGSDGQEVFELPFVIRPAIGGFMVFVNGEYQHGAFACSEAGTEITDGETRFVNAGYALLGGENVRIISSTSAAAEDITDMYNDFSIGGIS